MIAYKNTEIDCKQSECLVSKANCQGLKEKNMLIEDLSYFQYFDISSFISSESYNHQKLSERGWLEYLVPKILGKRLDLNAKPSVEWDCHSILLVYSTHKS